MINYFTSIKTEEQTTEILIWTLELVPATTTPKNSQGMLV